MIFSIISSVSILFLKLSSRILISIICNDENTRITLLTGAEVLRLKELTIGKHAHLNDVCCVANGLQIL